VTVKPNVREAPRLRQIAAGIEVDGCQVPYAHGMSGTYEWTLILGAVAAVVTLVRCRRQVIEQWDATATLIFATGWLLNPTHFIASLTGGYALRRIPDSTDFVVTYSGLAISSLRYGLIAILVVTPLFIFHRLARRHPVSRPPLVALCVSAVILLSNWANGYPWQGVASVVVLVLLGAAAVSRPGLGARMGAAVFAISLAVASALVLAVDSRASTRPCGGDKCSLLGVLYTGALANENALGIALAVGLSFVLISFHGRTRLVSAAFVVLSIVATGSRTSMFATGATLLVFLVIWPLWQRRPPVARTVGALAVLVLTGAALLAPLLLATSDIHRFTGRGRLWQLALTQLEGSKIVGLGGPGWAQLQETTGQIGDEATYSPHNQWLDAAYAGGVLATVLLAVFLIVVYRSGRERDQLSVVVVLIAVMAIGITERAWSFASPDWMFWSVLAASLTGSPAAQTARQTSTRHTSPKDGMADATRY
jgi:hypothetical protein